MTHRRRVYLARHGAVSYFEAGQDDLGNEDPPLNSTGVAQAEAGPQIYRRIEQDAGCLNVLDIEGNGNDARVAFVRLVNFTPYNVTKLGMHQTTLEMLWQQFLEG